MDLKKYGLLAFLLGKSASGLGQAPSGNLETTPSSGLITGSNRNISGIGIATVGSVQSMDDSQHLPMTLKCGLSNLMGEDGELKPHHDMVQFALGITIAGRSYTKELLNLENVRTELLAQDSDRKIDLKGMKMEFTNDPRASVGGKMIGVVDTFVCVAKSGKVMVMDNTVFSKHCEIKSDTNGIIGKSEQQKTKKSRGR